MRLNKIALLSDCGVTATIISKSVIAVVLKVIRVVIVHE